MEHLKGSHSGEQIGKDISTHADQILSLLERRGIVEDQSIPSQKAREAEQELRRNMYLTMTGLPALTAMVCGV